MRIIDPENPIVRHILKSFNWKLADGSHLRTEAALAYDAVQLFASGYARLRNSIKRNFTRLFCNGTETWGHGYSLSNYIRNVSARLFAMIYVWIKHIGIRLYFSRFAHNNDNDFYSDKSLSCQLVIHGCLSLGRNIRIERYDKIRYSWIS